MGAGASSLPRLRKALLMKAYNSRKQEDLSLFEQFLPFAHQKDDSAYYIYIAQVKVCLGIENNKDYAFLDEVLYNLFHKSPYSSSQPAVDSSNGGDIYFYDFIQFLETGKVPSYDNPDEIKNNNTNTRNLPGPDVKKKPPPIATPSSGRNSTPPRATSTSTKTSGNKVSASPGRPPQPPRSNDGGNNAEEGNQPRTNNNDDEEEEVIQINLARIPSSSSSVKISSSATVDSASDSKSVASGSQGDNETLEIIVRPSKQGLGGGQVAAGKQLWRKREVVRQEKSVHYTTVDENGELQELVEKETTQTEVLHMECRETGEFAHREITQYEQLETFNEEVVNVVRGNEEYVHLKSMEDEFHFMDSNMPPKERDERELEEEEARRAMEGEEGAHPQYYYDPNEEPDPNDPNDPRNDPDHRAETSSYHGHYEDQPEGEGETPYSRYKLDPEYTKDPIGAKDRSYLFEQTSPDAANYHPDYYDPTDDNQPPPSTFKAHSQSFNPDNISPISDVFELNNKEYPEVILQEPDALNQTMKLSDLHASSQPEEVRIITDADADGDQPHSELHRATSYESMHDID